MPGLVGFTIPDKCLIKPRFLLQKMQDIITHEDFYKRDHLFCDDYICSTRSHINIIQKDPQPYKADGIYIWIDGELYNRREISVQNKSESHNDAELLLILFQKNRDLTYLKQIDGIFSAVIYDSIQRKLYLISDRYGLRHLYWTVNGGSLAWSTEVKALLGFPGLRPRIDQQALKEFFNIGYLLEDRTWFEGIELLSSGTILVWDIVEKTIAKRRYWWWDDIKAHEGRINESEATKELGRLFVEAVEHHCYEGERIGLMLSGGLDSRAILAAIPNIVSPIHAVTFGKEGCDDILIASLATKVKGAIHHTFNIRSDNWLMPRLNGIWWTDGQLNLMHMHGIEFRKEIREFTQINLNGFAGDLVLGGSYLKDRSFLDRGVDKRLIEKVMGCNSNVIENIDNYSTLRKADFYFIQNRVRRFTYGGTKNWLTMIEQRKPFFNYKLIDFIYSLPDALRFNSRIYKKMLLETFPAFYEKIPWQKTGISISSPDIVVKMTDLTRKIKNKLYNKLHFGGIACSDPYNYTNYQNWLRQEPAHSFCEKILMNHKALYQEYIPKNIVYTCWNEHLEGKNRAELICLYLTFEIWLQQIFEGCYRTIIIKN